MLGLLQSWHVVCHRIDPLQHPRDRIVGHRQTGSKTLTDRLGFFTKIILLEPCLPKIPIYTLLI